MKISLCGCTRTFRVFLILLSSLFSFACTPAALQVEGVIGSPGSDQVEIETSPTTPPACARTWILVDLFAGSNDRDAKNGVLVSTAEHGLQFFSTNNGFVEIPFCADVLSIQVFLGGRNLRSEVIEAATTIWWVDCDYQELGEMRPWEWSDDQTWVAYAPPSTQ